MAGDLRLDTGIDILPIFVKVNISKFEIYPRGVQYAWQAGVGSAAAVVLWIGVEALVYVLSNPVIELVELKLVAAIFDYWPLRTAVHFLRIFEF